MNTELFEALKLLEKEKGIPVEYMLSQIEKSILVACKSAYGGNNDARVEMDPEKGKFDVYLNKEVVEEVFDPDYEISLQDARAINAKAQLEDKVGVKLDPKQFGRIAVQVARNTIRQGIRDGEKSQVLVEFQSKVQEIVSAQVERVDPKTGNATIRIGKAEAVLPRGEQVAGEVIHEGDTIKVYVADVKNTEKGPRVIIQELTLTLLSVFLRKKFLKFMMVSLRLNLFQEKLAQEQRLLYSAVMRMLTQEELALDLVA